MLTGPLKALCQARLVRWQLQYTDSLLQQGTFNYCTAIVSTMFTFIHCTAVLACMHSGQISYFQMWPLIHDFPFAALLHNATIEPI